jgi:hypothetical protein
LDGASKRHAQYQDVEVGGRNILRIQNVPVSTKYEAYQTMIKIWNKEVFGNFFEVELQLEKEMEKVQMTIIEEGIYKELTITKNNLHQEIKKRDKHEEILWKQKSRI